ncbi:GNAT family N-acetyltransferase [Microbispora sp. NBC_01189]|uniref:GNAT family N-acetyltransferase n=1 Tax=Microbispora sp. NBC_01189 TaxID=2903583 RepID=UPI002E0DCFA9|nr:GNAT family N-acetyltransferase [Microbispora sp. NBC_01189]
MGITFRHLTGTTAADAFDDEYADVYMEIRAEPPYNSGPLYRRDRFLERTHTQAQNPGFTLVAAEDGDTLAGFAFGLPFPAGRWWGGETTLGPAEVVAADKFAVIELNLREPYRGRGIGRRLLDELMSGRQESYAVLLSLPTAPAHAMYERWGWRVVGTCRPAPDAMVADVMVLDRGPAGLQK